MSETVKNTFFRFVTLRSPELVTEKDKQDYHVHHPNPTGEGFFATQLANPAATPAQQAAALTQRAASFSGLTDTTALKNLVSQNFFDFSVWLAKNRKAVFNKEAVSYQGIFPATLPHATAISLWDNLFYQLITNKNPQLRQLVIETLVANAYLAAGETFQHQLAEARAVIPSAFFGGQGQISASRTASGNESGGLPVYTEELKLISKAVAAGSKISEYETLLDELTLAERKYAAVNHTAYQEARKTYESNVAQTLKDFYTHSPVDGKEVESGSTIPQGPEIQDFEFIPTPEMQTSLLNQFLSERSLVLLQELGLADASTFEEATATISNELKKLAAEAAATAQAGTKSLVINGHVFPVSERILPILEQYSFYMQPVYKGANRYSILTTIDMGEPGIHAANSLYHAVMGASTNTNGAFNETAQGNSLTLEFYPGLGMPVPQGVTDFRFHGEIGLSNGTTLLFDVTFNIWEGAWGTMLLEGQPGEEGGGLNIEAPTGFGVRRIGVADYRKVEQSVCCYVPGEVSHIENIMAKEYKEKSSRRLSRIEDTSVFESSMEKEVQKDTSTTERFELQKEVNTVISQQNSADTHTSVNGKIGTWGGFDAGASFAFNTSREDSNRNAVNYSKEVTEKALERVVQKVREERTIKIIEEFEEQNKHGFDNRKGNAHVSGVYRWIDKIYKNQVFNFGKRLMYEFMIPQPATFHNEAIKIAAKLPTATVLEKPADPRLINGIYQLKDHTRVNAVTFPYWAAVYKGDFTAAPDEQITISQAFELSSKEGTGDPLTGAKSFKMEIPEGYEATKIKVGVSYVYAKSNYTPFANVRVANSVGIYIGNSSGDRDLTIDTLATPIRKEIGVAAESRNLGGITVNVTATCRRTTESYEKWQIDSFSNIMTSFRERLDEYNKAMEELKSRPLEATSKEVNPGFYRQIENTVLRKNCITYMVKHANMGLRFYEPGSTAEIRPLDTADMDRYAALVKFMEQAFEWDVMSYKFYPFYWGAKADWQQLYQQEVSDPLFRSFLQSGMARVIASVRPGFEEAVMYFMATGKVWNGGAVPAIGDDLYLSIVEELKNPVYYIDETWETRVPTTLTVIQAGSIGLNTQGLPCECGDTQTGIVQLNTVLVGEGDEPTEEEGEEDPNPEGDGGGAGDPEYPGTPPPNPEGGE
ncbi:MAG: hypothetical protein JNM88_04165 [Chitinophagaceae bacterium]|nr:hypothetical protein [Chitinophagaceae bacterium]